MNLQIGRFDLVVAAMLGAVLTFLSGSFSPAARTVETQLAIVIRPSQSTLPRDPDAGGMNAKPDRNNWGPADGQSRYGDGSSPDDDQDDGDDLDNSYDPPEPADTTPI